MLWVTVVGIIILPIVGTVFNALITKKIDAQDERIKDLEDARKEDKKEFYNQLNGLRQSIAQEYVRRDLYDQAMQFHQKETDTKFLNLIDTMNKNFQNVEADIKEVKNLINSKFNGKNQGE